MLSDTKKKFFKKLLAQMLDGVLTVDSRSMDGPDGSSVTQSDPSDIAIAEVESTFSFRMKERKGGLIKKNRGRPGEDRGWNLRNMRGM